MKITTFVKIALALVSLSGLAHAAGQCDYINLYNNNMDCSNTASSMGYPYFWTSDASCVDSDGNTFTCVSCYGCFSP